MYQSYSSFFAAKELGKQLEAWLSGADLTHGPARAIIAPYVPLKFSYVLPKFFLGAACSNSSICLFQACWLPVLWCVQWFRLSSNQPCSSVSRIFQMLNTCPQTSVVFITMKFFMCVGDECLSWVHHIMFVLVDVLFLLQLSTVLHFMICEQTPKVCNCTIMCVGNHTPICYSYSSTSVIEFMT